jgi:ubiquinone biosynthesis protein
MLGLKRLLQVIAVTAREVSPLLLAGLVRLATLGRIKVETRSGPQVVRRIFEELGGGFIKYGQILAMRPDVIPREYVAELSRLLDAVPPFPADEAVRTVEEELGAPLSELFRSFEPKQIAAASFAQVHKAVLASGESVVVKILRPGLERIARADIGLVVLFARTIDFLGLMARVRFEPLAEEFRNWTEDELDLRVEATYAQRLRDVLKDAPRSYIPQVYWDYTTRRVMTMEYLEGVWVSQMLAQIDNEGLQRSGAELEQRDIDLDLVASNIIENQLRMVFECRLFHGDPHAGNLVVMKDNVIGYVDFGITGELDSEFRETQLMLYDALQRRDSRQYMRAIYRLMKPPPDDIDLDAFEREIKRNAAVWQNSLHNPRATLQERSSSWLMARNFKVIRDFGLEVAQVAVRYYRALSVVELIVLRLNPTFDFVMALAMYLRQLELRELARQLRLEAQLQELLSNRLLVHEGLAELRKVLKTYDAHEGVARRQVAQWRLKLSSLLKFVALVALLSAVALPLLALGSTRIRLLIYSIGIARTMFWSLALSAACGWAGQRLYIESARHGAVVVQPRG